jgi:plasmid stabilization system protein ParE
VFRVVVSPRAWQDFFEIFEYIDRDNSSAASEFGRALLSQIELLASFPHIGALVPQRKGIRKVLNTPIRIYYRIDYESKVVEVLHFWHAARRDPEEL